MAEDLDIPIECGFGEALLFEPSGPIFPHRRFGDTPDSVPPLLMALGYEVIFQTSISELFPGLRQTIEIAIEKNLADFEITLKRQHSALTVGERTDVMRKLEWLMARSAKPIENRSL